MVDERGDEVGLSGVLTDFGRVVLVEGLGGRRFGFCVFRGRNVGFGIVRSFRGARRNEERESKREEKCADRDTPKIAFYEHLYTPRFICKGRIMQRKSYGEKGIAAGRQTGVPTKCPLEY